MERLTDTNPRVPAYLQLYERVREDIVSGIYPAGSKLPSKRTVAADSGVSTVTVEHAYGLLCDEGYVEPRERSGYFVIFRAADGFVSTPVPQPPYAHKATQPSTDFPFSVLARTMRKVITDAGEGMLERAPASGTTALREAIRGYLARNRGIRADMDQIVIGSGSEYLYTLLVGLLGRRRVYAIETPSYKQIEQVYTASDVRLQKLRLSHDGIDSAALAGCTADVLHITPYRSYPSGVTATASKRHAYLQWADGGERYIIEDDFESEFSVSRKAEETLFSHAHKENVIYMNTFSKTLSPSFRIGYMVLPRPLAQAYRDRLGFLSCTVPTYMQLVLAELINGGHFERHINRVRRNKRKAQGK